MRIFVADAKETLNYDVCGNLVSKDGFLHHRRSFEFNVLILVKEGTLYINQNGVNYKVGKNQYIFLRAGEEHYGYQPSTGKLSYLWVHFTFNGVVAAYHSQEVFAKQMQQLICDKSSYIIPETGELSLTQRAPLLFNQLLDLSRQENLYCEHMIDYALSLLIMEIAQEFIDSDRNVKNNISPNIAQIMEWIKANYYRNITIQEIAKEFSYNQDYISTLFKKATGITMIQYINQTRVNIAKSLIINYEVSIKEAAYTCGFADEKYFMKVFKKIEGMTPSEYKKAFSKKRITH